MPKQCSFLALLLENAAHLKPSPDRVPCCFVPGAGPSSADEAEACLVPEAGPSSVPPVPKVGPFSEPEAGPSAPLRQPPIVDMFADGAGDPGALRMGTPFADTVPNSPSSLDSDPNRLSTTLSLETAS